MSDGGNMNNKIKFAGVLAAMFTSFAAMPAANASVLLTNEGTSFISMSDTFNMPDPTSQPLATVTVGGSDVFIGGFGVFGKAEAPTSLMWVIFEGNSNGPKYTFNQTVTATTDAAGQWFNSPSLNSLNSGAGFQLVSGQTYAMGVVSTGSFAWSRNYDPNLSDTFPSIQQNGLTLESSEAVALVGFNQSSFVGDPTRFADADSGQFFPGAIRSSVQIFSAGDFGGGPTPPIPEPAEWSMLLAGLLVVAFVANRQRRQPV
jgi:hypothetical protein